MVVEKKKKVPKNFKEIYYSLSEEEMQELLARAKTGNDSAQLELLKIFNNFLTKYINLLFYSRYNIKDYDIRRFIALFIKSPFLRSALLRNKLTAPEYKQVAGVIRGIQYMVVRYGDEEDVRQTIEMTFLSCVNVYTRKGEIPFSGFLYSYFFYVLKKQVD